MHETDGVPHESLPSWARAMLSITGGGPGGHEGSPSGAGAGAGVGAGAGTGVSAGARATAAIMERVRQEPRPRRAAPMVLPPMRASRWTRRGLLTPFGAAALAGMLGLMLSLRAVTTLRDPRGATGMTFSAIVIGDTVMPSLGDSVSDSVRDTLRIVEFVLRGPSGRAPVRSVDVIGDFNAWRRGATAMAQRDDGLWYARAVVPRDVVRFAYAVDDEPRPRGAAPSARAGTGRTSPPPVMRARIDSI